MFTSFNSVELITVSSLEEQTKLRNLLTHGGVEHMVSVKDPHQTSGFFSCARSRNHDDTIHGVYLLCP
ncbi:unknown [Clostridium sp. CAG:505]|nr:unknown [Clostridium sp. CAG:505]